MSRIRFRRPSAALLVATVALVTALAGGAVAGVTISKLNKKERSQVKRIAERKAKRLDKKIELQPGPQGVAGPQGQRGEQGPKGDKGEPGEPMIKGQGDLTATTEETILSVPQIDLEVRTDGDADDDKQVRLYNTSPDLGDSMAHLDPGAGNASVILGAGDFGVDTAPGSYGARYLDGGSDPDSYTPESALDSVVQKSGVRVWLTCIFPLDEVMCKAILFP